jgi:hypothetical protein
MTSLLMWKAVELHFTLSRFLLPFPFSFESVLRKFNFESNKLYSKYCTWYIFAIFSTSSLFIHSVLKLGLELYTEPSKRFLSHLQIIVLLGITFSSVLAIECLFTAVVHGKVLLSIVESYLRLESVVKGRVEYLQS